MKKTKLIIHERFNGKQSLEDVFLSAFQSESYQLLQDNPSSIMSVTEQSQELRDTYINPAETGFYYLKSRYYDPEVGRFISADGEIAGVGGDVNGYNLYSYCFNKPVNMSDPDGNWPISLTRWMIKSATSFTLWIHKTKNKLKSKIKK